jgi:hypothetical protein
MKNEDQSSWLLPKAKMKKVAYTLADTLNELDYIFKNVQQTKDRVRKVNDTLRNHWEMPGRQYNDDEFYQQVYAPLFETYGTSGLTSWQELSAIPKRAQ